MDSEWATNFTRRESLNEVPDLKSSVAIGKSCVLDRLRT